MRDEPEQQQPRRRPDTAAAGVGRSAPAGTAGSISPARMISLARRQTGTFAIVFAAVLAATMLYAASQVPLYRASAEIAAAPGTTLDPQQIRSRDLARDVATALRLDRDAAFLQPGGLIVQRLFRSPAPDARPIDRAIDRLVEGVSVDAPDDTLSLLIGFTARDPAAAARIADEYARQSIRRDKVGARLLSGAEVPATPVTRSRWLVAAGGLVLALLAGLAAALLRERMFGGITTGDEIERRTGLHTLGTVPLLPSDSAGSPVDAIVAAPRSGFAESFRSLRSATRIAAGEGGRSVVVAVTAAAASAGTSTLAACLARTVALAGERVVLVAADGVSAFETTAPQGGVVTGDAAIDAALRHDPASGAYFARNVDDTLIATLRQHFAWIIIDMPEDAPQAALADVVLVAVRWRATSAAATRKLADRLSETGASAFAVLTQVDMRRQAKYVHGDIANYYGRLSKYYS